MNETSKIILSGEYSRRRGYLTNVIVTIDVLAITGTISILGFFVKWDILLGDSPSHELFAIQLAWASGVSSILLGLWRFYARHLDNAIIQLYPAMYLCGLEIIPDEIPIIEPPKNVPRLTKDNISEGIAWKNICNKDFRGRGHHFIDWITVILICAFSAISLSVASTFEIISLCCGTPHLVGWLLIGNIIGLLLVFGGWWRWNSKEVRWPVPKS